MMRVAAIKDPSIGVGDGLNAKLGDTVESLNDK
jgi:hypothetical protein